jgi:hypothetical protein
VTVRWAFESTYTPGPGGSGCEERKKKRDNKDEKVEETKQHNTPVSETQLS